MRPLYLVAFIAILLLPVAVQAKDIAGMNGADTIEVVDDSNAISEELFPPKGQGLSMLQGHWLAEYYDAGKKENSATTEGYGEKGNTIVCTHSVWPKDDAASTGVWNFYGGGNFTVSPEGKIYIQHGYGMMGHWGGVSNLVQVGPNEVSGRWNYQERYGGAVVWRRVKPEITRVTLSSDVVDDFNPGQRQGRVEKTYAGYGWLRSTTARAVRPSFSIRVYGKNLWGRHNVRIEPQSNSANVVDWDLELLGYGTMKEAGHGPPSDVIGLNMEVIIWAGAVPGRKTLYVDDIAIPFDFVVHGHPMEKAVVKEMLFVKPEPPYEPIEDILFGEYFRVKFVYNRMPDETTKPVVELESELTYMPIEEEGKPTDDPLIFLSDPILVVEPDDEHGRIEP